MLVYGTLRQPMATSINITLTSSFNPTAGAAAAVAGGNVTDGGGGPGRGFSIQPVYWCDGNSYPPITAGLLLR